MATELATAYISLVPTTRGMGRNIARGLDSEMVKAGGPAGRSLGRSIIGSVTKVAAIGGGIAGALFGGKALASGLKRLTTIQDSTVALTTIMGDAGKAGKLLDEILGVVRGTPFNLDQFAMAGKNLVAFGADAEKVPGYLTAIGEAAAATGKGQAAVDSLSSAFGKISARGRIYMDDVWQISESGADALTILANGFGVSVQEMQNMISQGAVPAEKALDLLTDGIINGSSGAAGATVALGGSMAALRDTFSGALGGLGASVARFGASILAPFMGDMTAGMTGTATAIDSMGERAGAAMQRLADSDAWAAVRSAVAAIPGIISAAFERIGELKDRISEFLQTASVQNLKTDSLDRLRSIWDGLKQAFTDALPALKDIWISLQTASAAIGISVWQLLLATLQIVADLANEFLVPALRSIATFMKENQAVVTVLSAAFVAWRVAVLGMAVLAGVTAGVKALNLALVSNPIGLVIAAIGLLVAAFVWAWQNSETFRNVIKGAWEVIQFAAKFAWENYIKPAIDAIVAAFVWVWNTAISVKDGIVAAWNAITAGLSAAWQWLSENVIRPVVGAFQAVWDKAVAIKDGVVGAWNTMKDGLRAGWEWLSRNVIEPVKSAFQSVWDKMVAVKDGIVGAWQSIAETVSGVFDGVVGAVKTALNAVFNFINIAMIAPLNKILDPFFTKDPPIGYLPKLHSGGHVPGRGEKPYMLLGGESVLNPDAARRLGKGTIDALNSGKDVGGNYPDAMGGMEWPGWGAIWDGLKEADPRFKGAENALRLGLASTVEKVTNAARTHFSSRRKNAPLLANDGAAGAAISFGDGVVKWARNIDTGYEKEQAKLGGGLDKGGFPDLSGGFAFPLPRGSYRVGGGLNSYPGHTGQDFPAAVGTPVFAPFAGQFQGINLGNRSYGRYANVMAGGLRFIGAHLSALVGGNRRVAKGEMIGRVGSTGNSTGPHLHAEFRNGGRVESPSKYLSFDTGNGYLPEGTSLVHNGTGGPEPLVDPRKVDVGSGRQTTININSTIPEQINMIRHQMAIEEMTHYMNPMA